MAVGKKVKYIQRVKTEKSNRKLGESQRKSLAHKLQFTPMRYKFHVKSVGFHFQPRLRLFVIWLFDLF